MPQLTNTELGLTDNAELYGSETGVSLLAVVGLTNSVIMAVLRKFERNYFYFLFL
jgi:hypothetical protein